MTFYDFPVFCMVVNPGPKTKTQTIFELVQKTYHESMEFNSFVPTPMYGTNSIYAGMAVEANDHIKPKIVIPWINRFTALIAEKELTKKGILCVCSST